MTNTVLYHVGDVREAMTLLDTGSVGLVVTSPPFLALRSYLPEDHVDKHREIGSEATPAAFLDTMLALTADWRRIVADWGSIAVELGDTMSGSGSPGGDYAEGGMRDGQPRTTYSSSRCKPGVDAPLQKSLMGIPTLYTWSLAYGRNLLTGQESAAGWWRIRNLLTWTRPNPPVGALGDKFRPATSFVTVACTGGKRWFDLDAVRLPGSDNTHARTAAGVDRRATTGKAADDARRGGNFSTLDTLHDTNGAPPLDWWDANDLDDDQLAEHWQPLHRLPTSPYKGTHYATFPVALPQRLIEAMCPREVCTACGEPRRRIMRGETDRSGMEWQPLLAAHIKERREALGITSAEINQRLGYKEIAKNWERTDRHGAAIPNPDDWAVIKPWLGLSDEFDDRVMGERRWTTTPSMVEYDAAGRRLDRGERRTDYGRGGVPIVGDRIKAQRVAPKSWTDCGHDAYRPGIVLDPFGGSGTTAVAAARAGRDAILIDVDARNRDLARHRIAEQLRIVDEHTVRDTTVWTVEAPLPNQRAQAEGQRSIFDELEASA